MAIPKSEVRRNSAIKQKYGITLADLNKMLEQQGHSCAICRKGIKAIGSRKLNDSACVDHCHDTGKVRSLLCRSCNTGIGLLCDSPELLVAAASYLSLHK